MKAIVRHFVKVFARLDVRLAVRNHVKLVARLDVKANVNLLQRMLHEVLPALALMKDKKNLMNSRQY